MCVFKKVHIRMRIIKTYKTTHTKTFYLSTNTH